MCFDTPRDKMTTAEQILGPRDHAAEQAKHDRVRTATRKLGRGVEKRMAEYRDATRQIQLGEKK